MPTGFQKFANKALQEGPISINGQQQGETPESREVKKFETVSRTGMESRGGARARRIDEEETTIQKEETQPVEKAAEAAEVQKPVEKLFQVTIKIKPETKEKLDWLKFTQKKKFMELAEEAFEDIYKKYGGK